MWGLVIVETLDHIYLQFTPSCLDLWAIEGITFPAQRKQASKQAMAGGGLFRWREEGGMDRGREKKEARVLYVNAGWDCKASWAMTAKCANFLQGPPVSQGGLTELWHWGTFCCLFRSTALIVFYATVMCGQFFQNQFVRRQGWAFICSSIN